MISCTPRHCWNSPGEAAHRSVTRPLVCCARRVAKRSATADSGVLSTTTRNLRGARAGVEFMGGETTGLPIRRRGSDHPHTVQRSHLPAVRRLPHLFDKVEHGAGHRKAEMPATLGVARLD